MSIAPHNASTQGRRDAILKEVATAAEHASSSFASIEAVIAATRFSYQDIVDAFGNGSGLLVALVERLAMSMLEPLGDGTAAHSFHDSLQAFGRRVTDARAASQLKCLYRIALTDAIRQNGLARNFYRRGPGLVAAGLAGFFDAAQAAGIVVPQASHALASHLMALLRSSLDLSNTIALRGASSETLHVPGDISQVIELFCGGIEIKVNHAYFSH
ncbi:TetR/AcrR family transcriptional regulator C-terminal domain-containing protein [Variovorax sp. IB41]|uniref:TetR/AcrR family transcriptional regulator C-terminal domain-containing protein n=1 Tax=Variovorax sp. IB41 TaxID=2779370 RepID=UPI0018E7918B|nr:TetR/AcrR family transcriptional regulator C-terminal domain-containing protein [Variovorax sp. IB41]MBJ2154601.1 TetR/AcrR family transcriptional regulator C-terminal domain-containing protein [Variovorax sp. IB41]